MDTKGKVMTVLGPVEPRSLGQTMTHEHLSLDFHVAYTAPANKSPDNTRCKIEMKNLGWLRQNPYSHEKNLTFCGAEVEGHIMEELRHYKGAGGGCIVENTTKGIERNISFIKTAAVETEVALVAGTGYYVDGSQSDSTRSLSIEAACDVMTKELTQGCADDPSVKCGIIGEVGCSWPITAFERLSIQAAGLVQERLGCPVMFHPGRHETAPEEILRVFAEAGGSVKQAVMGHLDRTIHTLEELVAFASLGSYLEYDLFGVETSHYQLNDAIDMPSDAQRIDRIKHLVENGYADRILLSHDIHTRHRLSAYGGHGFSHILENIVPKMICKGIPEAIVKTFLTDNPHRWLTYTK